jgi:hypothetical protein
MTYLANLRVSTAAMRVQTATIPIQGQYTNILRIETNLSQEKHRQVHELKLVNYVVTLDNK